MRVINSSRPVWKKWALVSIGVVVVLFLFELMFPYGRPKWMSIKTAAFANAKRLCIATAVYRADHDERFPPALSWMDAIRPQVAREAGSGMPVNHVFHSPLADPENHRYFGFAFHQTLDLKPLSAVLHLESEPLIFDSVNIGWNATGTLDSLPVPGRYRGDSRPVNIVGYVDTHVKYVPDNADPRRP